MAFRQPLLDTDALWNYRLRAGDPGALLFNLVRPHVVISWVLNEPKSRCSISDIEKKLSAAMLQPMDKRTQLKTTERGEQPDQAVASHFG